MEANMSKIIIEFDVNNSAFMDENDCIDEELVFDFIRTKVAPKAFKAIPSSRFYKDINFATSLKDINGNTVGTFKFHRKDH